MQEIPAMRPYSASMNTNKLSRATSTLLRLPPLVALFLATLPGTGAAPHRRAAAAAYAYAVGAPRKWSERCYVRTRISSSETESSR